MRSKIKMSRLTRSFLKNKYEFVSLLRLGKTVMKTNHHKVLSMMRNNNSNFPVQMAVLAILKNEAAYVEEWIEYHRLVGVEKFYLFDNESSDNLKDVLKRYIEDGIVELESLPGKGQQLVAYQMGIEKAKSESKWLAIIDADEFIQPLENENIVKFLEQEPISGMFIGWQVFGSSHHVKRQSGLVIENYLYHADENFIADYKMIINPRKVLKILNPHYVQLFGRVVDENFKRVIGYPASQLKHALPSSKERIRINHYYSKSWEEFQSKANRGYADGPQDESDMRESRNRAAFDDHDQNTVFDDSMLKYVDAIKEKGVFGN